MNDITRKQQLENLKAELAERWPHLFNKAAPVPFKVGIREEITAALPDVDAPLLRKAVNGWCQSFHYMAALKPDAPRYGLDGEPDGAVTTEQAEDALRHIETLKQRLEQKRISREAEAKRQAEVAAAKPEKIVPEKKPKAAPKPQPVQVSTAKVSTQVSSKHLWLPWRYESHFQPTASQTKPVVPVLRC